MDASREPYGVAAVGLSDGSHGSVSHTSRPLPRTGSALRPLARSIAARVNRVAQHFGIEIRKFSPAAEREFDNWSYYARLLETAWTRHRSVSSDREAAFVDYCIAHHRRSKSQIFQDLLVLFLLGEKRNGFFVEFGATNGISLSNSYLLETAYGWRGILAEPARIWHKALKHNRRAIIDTRCVWACTGETVEFTEAFSSELSTIDQFAGRDSHAAARAGGAHYRVATISLNDLLASHNAPRSIDYLSIDTEGSEYAILKNFDFSAFEIGIVTVEHNYAAPDRGNIASLMRARGFEQIFADYSLFDDWYVQKKLLMSLS
jgi:FkbM family methyltransferase